MAQPPGEWTPADATDRIRAMAAREEFSIALTGHAKDRMAERDLLMGDIRHLLRTGFVYDRPEPATREGYYKYVIEGPTPNSDTRSVKAVVIPGSGADIKVCTVMWRDER